MQKAFLVSATLVLLGTAGAVATVFYPAQTHAQGAKPESAATIHAGQEIFSRNCMQCHSINQGQMMFGPSLYAEMKKPQGKKSSAEVRIIIKNGKGKMPAFGEKLTAEDTDKLLAYLHTL